MIEILELKITAEVAINEIFDIHHIKTIQIAIREAINKNSDCNIVIGEIKLTIENKDSK